MSCLVDNFHGLVVYSNRYTSFVNPWSGLYLAKRPLGTGTML